jgi:hypothetical protein
MIEKHKDIIITTILLIIFSGLVFLNFVFHEIYGKRTQARIEMHDALEAQQQERLNARETTAEYIKLREIARDQDIKDVFSFDEEFSGLKNEYLESIAGISEELEGKVVNIDDIRALVDKRIAAARKFKERLENIEYIPGPLEDFHDLLIFFLENDISTWEATRSYYAGDYDGSDSDIKILHNENSSLYRQTEELQKEVYSQYGLEDLL